LNESNSLECREYDDEEESWVKSSLGEIHNVSVSPESKLSACWSALGNTVFFQDTAGQLKGVSSQNGPWELFGPLPAEAVLGTPMSVAIAYKQLHLFYMNKDSSLHYLVYDHNTGGWRGSCSTPFGCKVLLTKHR
jgi:hypothetical protein